jgi:hypothetical protein
VLSDRPVRKPPPRLFAPPFDFWLMNRTEMSLAKDRLRTETDRAQPQQQNTPATFRCCRLLSQGLQWQDIDVDAWNAVRKRVFLRCHLYIKMIILPRQARDKQRESTQKRTRFCRLSQLVAESLTMTTAAAAAVVAAAVVVLVVVETITAAREKTAPIVRRGCCSRRRCWPSQCGRPPRASQSPSQSRQRALAAVAVAAAAAGAGRVGTSTLRCNMLTRAGLTAAAAAGAAQQQQQHLRSPPLSSRVQAQQRSSR